MGPTGGDGRGRKGKIRSRTVTAPAVMRYLRMLTNAALAGALGAAFVGILILQLNPGLPVAPRTVAPLYLTLAGFYGSTLAVAFYCLIVVRQLFASRVLSPGWISMRLLAWLGTLLSAWAAWLMWQNLQVFGPVLEPEAARRMALGMWATAGCAVLLFVIAALHYSSGGRRASPVGATLFALTVVAALMMPLTARGWGRARVGGFPPLEASQVLPPTPAASRVWMLLLDGATLDYISPATAEGRLPHFGRLLDAGASMHLTTISPTQPGPVWAAATTGKLPPDNGVRSAASYSYGPEYDAIDLLPDLCFAHAMVHLGLLRERPNTSENLRARPLWQILGAAGVTTGVVGVPLTNPAFPVAGYLVSDRAHRAATTFLPVEDRGLVYPPDLFAGRVPGPMDLSPGAGAAAEGRAQAAAVPPLLAGAMTPRDQWYQRVAVDLGERLTPALWALRLEGVDQAGHLFLRYSRPRAFGDVTEDERRRYGQVLAQQYAVLDAEIGRLLAGLGPDDVLLIVSGFGMEPLSPGKRLLARVLGEPELTGTHERAPDGFLIAYGRPVARGRLALGSILDLTPTLLYLFGLPVARDMSGTARTDLFTREFTAIHPVTFIPTYDR